MLPHAGNPLSATLKFESFFNAYKTVYNADLFLFAFYLPVIVSNVFFISYIKPNTCIVENLLVKT